MTNHVLTIPDQKECLSRVYAHAVATRAGYLTATYDLDRVGIDLRIQAGGDMRPAIELQLKATVNLGSPTGGYFRFALKKRNYDLLIAESQTPRLLTLIVHENGLGGGPVLVVSAR